MSKVLNEDGQPTATQPSKSDQKYPARKGKKQPVPKDKSKDKRSTLSFGNSDFGMSFDTSRLNGKA